MCYNNVGEVMKDINYLKENGFHVDEVFDSFGSIELYEEILLDFYKEASTRINLLNDYLSKNDLSNYKILVHTIKGECAYLGINSLKDLAYTHQIKSEENDLMYIKNNVNSLIDELKRVIGVIKTYFGIE